MMELKASHKRRTFIGPEYPFIADSPQFPKKTPEFYLPPEEEEVVFDPKIHLALPFQMPTVWTLEDLGYDAQEASKCPSDLAITSSFPLLSERGVHDLRDICLKLFKYHQTHTRTANFVRGAVYRSKFLKDLCLCQEVTDFLSQISGTQLAPHSMPLQLGHINYAPQTVNQTIDKWHTDTTEFDYVVLLTDPNTFEGGKFQFFKGVASKATKLAQENNNTLPQEFVESPSFLKAGYAIFQQGSKVCHRASGLTKLGERITMVNSYVCRDLRFPDGSRITDLKGDYDKGYDPQEVLFTEWTLHKAWLARSKLEMLIKTVPFTKDSKFLCSQLNESVMEIQAATSDLDESIKNVEMHFGK